MALKSDSSFNSVRLPIDGKEPGDICGGAEWRRGADTRRWECGDRGRKTDGGARWPLGFDRTAAAESLRAVHLPHASISEDSRIWGRTRGSCPTN